MQIPFASCPQGLLAVFPKTREQPLPSPLAGAVRVIVWGRKAPWYHKAEALFFYSLFSSIR